MTPLGKRIFIKPDIEDVTPGGIVRARMSRQMPNTGIVTAISKQADDELCGMVRVGDRVLYDKHHQQLAEDEQSTITYADKILAILT